MKLGIIADIHGYKSPLELVLKDLKPRIGRENTIINLGDITSGGDQESEVVNILRNNLITSVSGNHCRQTRGYASSQDKYGKKIDENVVKYLQKLTPYFQAELEPGKKFAFVHDNPLSVIGNKEAQIGLTPWEKDSAIKNVEHARIVFDKCDADYIFVGHSHVPAHWELTKDGQIIETIRGDGKINEGSRYIINPGAVAEPKVLTPHSVANPKQDFDASYLIFNTDEKMIQRYYIPLFRGGKPIFPVSEEEKRIYR